MATENRPNRVGYEFSSRTKQVARERAGNRCEARFAPYCTTDTSVDHITSISVARRLGMNPDVVRSRSNAQIICSSCDSIKQAQEYLFARWIELGTERTFSPVQVEWQYQLPDLPLRSWTDRNIR